MQVWVLRGRSGTVCGICCRETLRTEKGILGRKHIWAQGYPRGIAGQANGEMIQKYIGAQGKEEGNENVEMVDG